MAAGSRREAGSADARERGGFALVTVLCLGVWLHAADSLLAATVMPSAVAEIGGLAFIYWTVALYQLGSTVFAGAGDYHTGTRNRLRTFNAWYG